MQDKAFLAELLNAESENEVLSILDSRSLFKDESRWKPLGGRRNNESIVTNQSSNAIGALVEKFTNGLDAILLRHCKSELGNPRSPEAPQSMSAAVARYFGDLSEADQQSVRKIAEENLVLYATGSKSNVCLSIYDDGEGQTASEFPTTFCSIISGTDDGAYKGAIKFVQGRFNMGGTGVLGYCGDNRKLQLIVSRKPNDIAGEETEWAFTLFCYFPSDHSPEWRYLVGEDGDIMTAGFNELGLAPKAGAKSGEVCAPGERMVASGTLVRMFDYKIPTANICGDLFRKLEPFFPQPALPLRIIECRSARKANVMGVTIWDQISSWGKRSGLEEGFENGVGGEVELSTGEKVPFEIRVFKDSETKNRDERNQTGLHALINGQSHGRRDTRFFSNKSVDKEHIADSLLVTLDCTQLGQSSRNHIFMPDRERFRDEPLQRELFALVQSELRDHEGLKQLDARRYEEKIGQATTDDDGVKALEELLSGEPMLAELFGSKMHGLTAAKTADQKTGSKIEGDAEPFNGLKYPTYFRRADGSQHAEITIPRGGKRSATFQTDVENAFFIRKKNRGQIEYVSDLPPTRTLYNGRLSFTFRAGKELVEGSKFQTLIEISDDREESETFQLTVNATVSSPEEKKTREKKDKPKVDATMSRPEIKEVDGDPEDLPLTVNKKPNSDLLEIVINKGSKYLQDARKQRPPSEVRAVEFVFKYGLALAAMGLIDDLKGSPEWQTDDHGCRERIGKATVGIAKVIVPLCLTLPQKLPKAA